MDSNKKRRHGEAVTESFKFNVTFDEIGGLEEQISLLREMVLLPLMYPKLFKAIQPPRGILFYGEPGTGKTLLARALANELSKEGNRVTFLSRKGADCLSQWLGESEKQLNDIFAEANQKRPAVIFFDEIDGLAPSRSCRQDQVYSSLVSTLLALMDGLDPRGDIFVIGATNRIDALDPALRRPGRFDREVYFPLPDTKARYEILKVHTMQWDEKPKDSILRDLAERSRGSCGADLEALCVEAALCAVRRCYPQIYQTRKKLCVDHTLTMVKCCDFAKALQLVVPAYLRIVPSPSTALAVHLEPLLLQQIERIKTVLRQYFPRGFCQRKNRSYNTFHEEYRVLLTGPANCGQTSYIAPALLNHFECPTFCLTPTSLYENSARSPEESCIQIFRDAKRSAPSVIYIPDILTFWEQATESLTSVFSATLRNFQLNSCVLVFATAQCKHEDLPEKLKQLFVHDRHEVLTTTLPSEGERRHFFQQLLAEVTKPPMERTESRVMWLNECVTAYSLRGRDVEVASRPGLPMTGRNVSKRSKSTGKSSSGGRCVLPLGCCESRDSLPRCSSESSCIWSCDSSCGQRKHKEEQSKVKKVQINEVELQKLLETCVKITVNQCTKNIVKLYQQLLSRCQSYTKILNRACLTKDFKEEIEKYKKRFLKK